MVDWDRIKRMCRNTSGFVWLGCYTMLITGIGGSSLNDGIATIHKDTITTPITRYTPLTINVTNDDGPYRYVTQAMGTDTPLVLTIGFGIYTINIIGRSSTHAFSARYLIYPIDQDTGGNIITLPDGTTIHTGIAIAPMTTYATTGLDVYPTVYESNTLVVNTNSTDDWTMMVTIS